MVNGDGDGLPGVIVDRYADVLVLQLLTAGADRMREWLTAELARVAHPHTVLERSHGAVRRQEGLEDSCRTLAGEPADEATANESGIRFVIDLARGQKTGAFLDQRENRAHFGALAHGRRILDAFCYAGGFALAGLAGGAARVVAVDTSARALSFARRNIELNRFEGRNVALVRADAGRFMAECDERFDLIVLDPPPLARSRADASRAARRYTELNASAMRLLAPGGIVFTFSCSVHLRGEEFVRAVRIAETKAGRSLRVLARLGAGMDHPVLLGHVEGEYLTGLVLADLD
jgi:23S rRNA (cytosine1962-C5)-methyltransferase